MTEMMPEKYLGDYRQEAIRAYQVLLLVEQNKFCTREDVESAIARYVDTQAVYAEKYVEFARELRERNES